MDLYIGLVLVFGGLGANMSQTSLFIGLTGGIGSGKTTVSQYLAKQGIEVLDADQISRQLTAPNGLAMDQIREVFGDTVITPENALDRDAMRTLVFSNPEVKQRLEQIIHPLVQQEMISQALRLHHSPYIIFDIPLLIESINRYRPLLNRICVVDCETEVQIERVKKRNGLSEQTIRQILQTQASRETRLLYADDVIYNGKGISLDKLQEQAYNFHIQWLNMKP